MDHSLIWRTDPQEDSPRFQMLATLREYAVERLEKRGGLTDCRHRHAAYFDDLAARKFDELRDDRQLAAARSLESEQPNLRTALEWCCSFPAVLETGMRLASRLWEFWLLHGDVEEGQTWMERLLSLDDARDKSQPGAAAPTLWRAYLLNGLGMLTHESDMQVSDYLDESLAIFRTLGDKYGEAWVLSHLGQITLWSGDYDQARVWLKESLDLFRQLRADWNIAWIFYSLADIAIENNQFPEAKSNLRHSLDLFEYAGDQRAMALCHYSFGMIARRRMDFTAAIDSLHEALRLVRIVGDPINIARFSFAIGDALLRNGNLAEATPRLLESLRVYRQKGESWGVAFSLIDLARVVVARHDDGQAASMLGAASVLFEPLGAYYQNLAREYYLPAEQEARTQLSDQDFMQAWQAGRGSLESILKSIDEWEEFGEPAEVWHA